MLEAEPGPSRSCSPLHQTRETAQVVTVAAVPDDDAPEVGALLGKDRLAALRGATWSYTNVYWGRAGVGARAPTRLELLDAVPYGEV